jgi:hypothetical protein
MTAKKSSGRNALAAGHAVEAQLQALCSEDNFGGGLTVLDKYPAIRTREISRFELDLRDWAFCYGVAFALAVAANPEMTHEAAAELAFWPARRVCARWGVQVKDPGERREAAIRELVERWNGPGRTDPSKLEDAVSELVEWARA